MAVGADHVERVRAPVRLGPFVSPLGLVGRQDRSSERELWARPLSFASDRGLGHGSFHPTGTRVGFRPQGARRRRRRPRGHHRRSGLTSGHPGEGYPRFGHTRGFRPHQRSANSAFPPRLASTTGDQVRVLSLIRCVLYACSELQREPLSRPRRVVGSSPTRPQVVPGGKLAARCSPSRRQRPTTDL